MELSEGIIIKTINYKETSKIIYLVTKDGLTSLEVKGANKINGHSHIYSSLLSKIAFSENKHFFQSGKVLNNYVKIKNNFDKLNVTLKILEFTYTLVEHICEFDVFYNFLSEILDLIEEEDSFNYYEAIFYIKTLYLLGIAPMFKSCVNCGKSTHLLGFVFSKGGMICKDCYKEYDSLYDTNIVLDVIKLYFTKLDKLKEEKIEVNYNGVKAFYQRYYQEYLGYTSKSEHILDKIM